MASKPKTQPAGTTPGKAARAMAEVGGVRSSDDPVLDLWWSGQLAEERRGATCSAEVKSSEGRGDGPQGLPAPKKVQKLQITLYRKAKSNPKYRFWSLYGEVQRADVLETAWRRVKAKAGAAGADGVQIAEIAADAQGTKAWLSALQEELRANTYRPAPLLRVRIPKANGGVRELGVPTVKDRVVQMAVNLVLMPIFEADFHPHSFAYRPRRGPHQAVEAIRAALYTGRTEVVDADLAQYFDTVPHRQLMGLVARRVSDGAILKLIRAWLRAPILEKKPGGGRSLKTNTCGTPQGGVISPLLANIYLHPLDEGVNEQCRQKPRMIRYADDLLIFCGNGQGDGMRQRLARWLKSRGLALNETKTRVLQSRESGFEFLGFSFRWQRSKKGKRYVHIEPSPAAEQELRDKVYELTRRHSTWQNTEVVVGEINQRTRGWSDYFALGHYQRGFGQMNSFIARRLRQWLWCKHDHPSGKHELWPDRALVDSYGLYSLPTNMDADLVTVNGTRKAGCGKTARPV